MSEKKNILIVSCSESIDWVLKNNFSCDCFIPLTPIALQHLRTKGLNCCIVDNNLEIVPIRQFATEGFKKTFDFCKNVDKSLDCTYADFCFFYIKRILDSSFFAYSRGKAISEKFSGDNLAFIQSDLEAHIQQQLLFSALSDLNLENLENIKSTDLIIEEDQSAIDSKAPQSASYSFRSQLRHCLGYLKRLGWVKNGTNNLLITSVNNDLLQYLKLIKGSISRLYFFNDNSLTVETIWPFFTALKSFFNNKTSVVTDTMPSSDNIKLNLKSNFHFLGKHLLEKTKERIHDLVLKNSENVSRGYRAGLEFGEKNKDAYILSGTTCPPVNRAFIAGLKEGGIEKLYAMQHGGGYGLIDNHALGYGDYYMTTNLLTYGQLAVESIKNSDYGIKLHKNLIPLGSPALQSYTKTEDSSVSTKSEILYIPTNFNGEDQWFIHSQPDLLYWQKMDRIIKILGQNTKNDITVKLHYKGYRDNPVVINQYDNIKIKTAPLEDTIKQNDLVIIDLPTTTLLQAMRRNCKIILYWDPYLGINDKALSLLRKSVVVYTNFEEFIKNLNQEISTALEKPSCDHSPFLSQYGIPDNMADFNFFD